MQDRQQLEERWRARLKDAKLRLDFAHQYTKEVERDFNDGTVPIPDGSYAYRKALRAESYALAEYQRVLRVYTVVSGKIPDESAIA